MVPSKQSGMYIMGREVECSCMGKGCNLSEKGTPTDMHASSASPTMVWDHLNMFPTDGTGRTQLPSRLHTISSNKVGMWLPCAMMDKSGGHS